MKFLLIQVIGTHDHRDRAIERMDKLAALVKTFGGEVVERTVQHRIKPDPATYIGKGKVVWLKEAVVRRKADVVVVNAQVKSGQLYRLERELWGLDPRVEVWDRVDLILSIFDKHASSREAKLQIELARLDHSGPRIYGLGRELSRQGGGIGTRGMGETNIEVERRMMKKRRQEIRRELKQVMGRKQKSMELRREKGLGPVALVGYTSAGKTSLFNRLTGKSKEEAAKLFTTLDTVVGQMKQRESEVAVVVSDTIGFMADLPPNLIEAFKSTLMEAKRAKLVLMVIDGADSKADEKLKTVEAVLKSLEIEGEQLKVVNKIDLLDEEARGKVREGLEGFLVSAKTGEGVEKLKEEVRRRLLEGSRNEADSLETVKEGVG